MLEFPTPTTGPTGSLPPTDDAGLLTACPWCHAAYRGIGMKFLIAKDNVNLVHVRCARCSGTMLVLVVASSLGVNSLGLLTDLTSEEVLRFHDAPSVTVDDVLDLYRILA